MEDIKALVEGYCQITGRPTFTITVDEFIKFHQLAKFRSPLSATPNVVANVVETKEEPLVEVESKETKSTYEVKKEVVEDKSVVKPKKEETITPPTTPSIQKKENVETSKPVPKKVETKNNYQVALEMLKSIKG